MSREIDKSLQQLAEIRERILEKFSVEEVEKLREEFDKGCPPLYSAIHSFDDFAYIESVLKKKEVDRYDRTGLYLGLLVLQMTIAVLEGASYHWTNGGELFDLCGRRLSDWLDRECGWPFLDVPTPFDQKPSSAAP